MALSRQADKKTLQLFRASHRLFSGKLSAAQQLQEVTIDLDPSNSKKVQAFYDKMPITVKTFEKWKREAAEINVATFEIGDDLTMAFDGVMQDPPEYTLEDVYEDFISTEAIDEIKNLESKIAHLKVVDVRRLAEDAAQDFASWEQFANNATFIGTTATSCAGVWGVLAVGVALSNPVGATVVGFSALSVVAFEFALGLNRSRRNKEGKLNMRDKALILEDICESTRRDVQLLDEIGGHAGNIAKCQQKVKKHGRINDSQRVMIIYHARKMKEACLRYMEREIKDE